jgi:myo-inositol-1(or 4)-monophosphatase
MMADLDLRLAAAKAVALEAGQLARRRFLSRRPGDYTLKGHQDFLTEVDGEVERFIVEALAKLFPRDGFLGEEGGPQAQSGAGDGTWIIDPIDGTANFARGITHFCISIGYFRAGRPEVGVIVAPMRDEVYAGAIGRGATLNGVPLAAATTARLDEASVELGWNTRRTTADYLKLLHPLLDAGLSVRRLGSGALGIVDVAVGRSDGYIETHINAWDVAAALVIAAEAGARVSDFFAKDGLARGNEILVAAPTIAADLSRLTGIALV